MLDTLSSKLCPLGGQRYMFTTPRTREKTFFWSSQQHLLPASCTSLALVRLHAHPWTNHSLCVREGRVKGSQCYKCSSLSCTITRKAAGEFHTTRTKRSGLSFWKGLFSNAEKKNQDVIKTRWIPGTFPDRWPVCWWRQGWLQTTSPQSSNAALLLRFLSTLLQQ